MQLIFNADNYISEKASKKFDDLNSVNINTVNGHY